MAFECDQDDTAAICCVSRGAIDIKDPLGFKSLLISVRCWVGEFNDEVCHNLTFNCQSWLIVDIELAEFYRSFNQLA